MTISKNTWPLIFLATVEIAVIGSALIFGLHALSEGDLFAEPLMNSARVAFICALAIIAMFGLGLYNWRTAVTLADVLVRLLAAFGIAYILYAVFVYFVDVLRLPPEVLSIALLISIPVILLLREGFFRLVNLNQLKSRVLILGTGKQAARIGELEKHGRISRFVTDAFITLEKNEPRVDASLIMPMPASLSDYARSKSVDEIVVALEERRGQLPLTPLIDCRLNGLTVTEYQTFCERVEGRIDLDALRPSWFFQSDGFRSSPYHKLVKRIFDLAVSGLLLTLTLPLLILTAIAVKLESPGPIFYRQERVGRGGKPFILFKFRSMRNDAESKDSPQWAQENDPRVTRVGAFIRKTRIDEIPQVLNVLKGDMSFVGPRPERPQFVTMLAEEIPFYQERHSVRPGITGWAQLNYPYGASKEDAKQKLQYDLFYIKYFSIIFDISIVLQTMRVVIWSDGAR